jgi:enoyl-CoA hydratase/carnithine racemase
MTDTTFRDRVRITVTDGIADVCMIRADKRNALDGAMFLALAEAGEHLKTAPGVRVAVLSGEGKSFCAGLDMGVMAQLAGGGDERAEGNPGALTASGITHLGQQVSWVWQEVPVPVIAAVHGHALGGGIQIALGADIRCVHPDTKMSVRELYWGLVPDMTGTFTLAGLVGTDIAKELVFTARIFDGREAFRLGLATHLTETPRDHAFALAAEIAANSPDAVRGAKELLNHLFNPGAANQFAKEREVIRRLVGRPNQAEAVMASFENRPPTFVDPV